LDILNPDGAGITVAKPGLVVPNNHCLAHDGMLKPYFSPYFDIKHTASPGDLIFYFPQSIDLEQNIHNAHANKNLPVIDNLWEQRQDSTNEHALLLQHPLWFWLHEYCFCKLRGYDKFVFNHATKTKRCLMPMRLRREHRSYTYEKVQHLLQDFIWSYQDKILPDDASQNKDDRYINIKWFEQTDFSLVVESLVLDQIFITEKTYKPIFCEHPFLLIAQPASLQFLKDNNFVGFDNIFDEDYDSEMYWQRRIDRVVEQIENYNGSYDKETMQRIKHNRQNFYNQERVQGIVNDIVEELLEYAEA
jgi:hypothetical protein